MLSRRAFVPAVLAVLLVGSSAQADEPFVTDPEGDAGRCSGFCLTPTVASDPAVDMLSADIQLHGQTLSFSWKLLDLDRISTGPLSAKADDDVTYMYSFQAGDLSLGVYAYRTYAHANPQATVHAYHYDGADHNVNRAVPFTFDGATSTVTVDVPLQTLNDAIAEACATCAPVGRGTVFTWVNVSAYIFTTVKTGTFLGDGWLGWGNVDNAGGYGSDYTVG